ncbi:unnamed protein product [Mytilus edulis]|uniref:Uncharacterized protein n=1 Tax=Mytilus edulis TaxID=6550 RepID=A0A8S3U9C8_MYTED|nr:unnamed protein product [Mytilus edulis]
MAVLLLQADLNDTPYKEFVGVTISPFAEIDSESVPSHDGEAKKLKMQKMYKADQHQNGITPRRTEKINKSMFFSRFSV